MRVCVCVCRVYSRPVLLSLRNNDSRARALLLSSSLSYFPFFFFFSESHCYTRVHTPVDSRRTRPPTNLPSNHRPRSPVRSTPSGTNRPYPEFANSTRRIASCRRSTGPNTKIPRGEKTNAFVKRETHRTLSFRLLREPPGHTYPQESTKVGRLNPRNGRSWFVANAIFDANVRYLTCAIR